MVISILLLGFWGVSFSKSHQLNVQATEGECWNYLTDINYYPLWYDGFIRYDKIQGNFKEVGVQYYLHIEDAGEKYTLIETFEALDSPSLIKREYQHDFYTLELRTDIEQLNDSVSTIQLQQKIYGTRFLENVFLSLYAHQVLHEQWQNYLNAKEQLEE